MRRAAVLLVWLAGAACAEEPAFLPPEDHAAWTAIGRLNVAGYRDRGMCTATLVAPDRVLTAAHCVTEADGRPVPLDRLRFVAGWLRGSYAAVGQVAALRLRPGYAEARARGETPVDTDSAVLTLTEPMAGVPPLATAPPDTSLPVRILGYRWDRPHGLSDAGPCRVFIVHQGVERLACRVTFGNSGGPVLQETPQGWRVVGIVSGMGWGGSFAAPLPPE